MHSYKSRRRNAEGNGTATPRSHYRCRSITAYASSAAADEQRCACGATRVRKGVKRRHTCQPGVRANAASPGVLVLQLHPRLYHPDGVGGEHHHRPGGVPRPEVVHSPEVSPVRNSRANGALRACTQGKGVAVRARQGRAAGAETTDAGKRENMSSRTARSTAGQNAIGIAESYSLEHPICDSGLSLLRVTGKMMRGRSSAEAW